MRIARTPAPNRLWTAGLDVFVDPGKVPMIRATHWYKSKKRSYSLRSPHRVFRLSTCLSNYLGLATPLCRHEASTGEISRSRQNANQN